MDMVEQVARAIYTEFIPAIERREGSTKKQWGDLDPDEDAIYLACWMQMARAAIEAMREPTEEMLSAIELALDGAYSAGKDTSYEFAGRAVWQAMIDAALKKE